MKDLQVYVLRRIRRICKISNISMGIRMLTEIIDAEP